MRMEHRFGLPLAADATWRLLTDLERIAPCMPGAELDGRDGDTYHGRVSVKVGPISARYGGTVRFAELDERSRRAVLVASGRDARGQGTAQADLVVQLHEEARGTAVHVVTELAISGKLAQFGRGALDSVSAKLLDQFVENLRAQIGEQLDTGARGVAEDRSSDTGLDIRDLVPTWVLAVAAGSVVGTVLLTGRALRRRLAARR